MGGPLTGSIPEFRKQLAQKNGVYCVLFDASCLSHGNGGHGQSLRDLLLGGQQVSLEVSDVLSLQWNNVKTTAV
jgi:hypothetical protein